MPEKQYILALDQGTTSSRCMVVGASGKVVALAQKAFDQVFPQPGWVEYCPREIWSFQIGVAAEALTSAHLTEHNIAAIGITNQRETTILWDRKTGEPVYNAIVWQDRRTAGFCDALRSRGDAPFIQAKTGLLADAYFSGSKLNWSLENVEGARLRAERGELAFGAVDSWLIWKLTNGRNHITDVSNAFRTMLFNIHTLQLDGELLKLFDIPASVLPDVVASSGPCAVARGLFDGVPIMGVAGDQQAALFGQCAIYPEWQSALLPQALLCC
jgi:glycerol kinase